MIQLMSFGLSRHTSNALANMTINKDMDASSAKQFLVSFSVEASGLSPYLASEVNAFV
jgi:hypothetical protein